MAENVTQTELDAIVAEKNISIQWADMQLLYEGTFKGNLIGQATTAKELENPYRLTLTGDVSGTTLLNASDTVMEISVEKAKYAEACDFAGKTTFATRASYADMANTAEYAYHAEKMVALFINLTGLVNGKGEVRNGNTIDVEVSTVDLSNTFAFSALPVQPDTTKVYVDIDGKGFWIYDNEESVWRNCYASLVSELNNNKIRIAQLENLNISPRLTDLEKRATTTEQNVVNNALNIGALTTRATNVENRASTLEKRADANDEVRTTLDTRLTSQEEKIANHEQRINSFETTSDVGKFAVRMLNVESTNNEQDERLSALELGKLELSISDSAPDLDALKNNTGVIFPSTNLL